MGKVLPFETVEQREIKALRSEVDSLKEEVQSLSENLTDLMGKLYALLETEFVGR